MCKNVMTLVVMVLLLSPAVGLQAQSMKSRLIIMADMGNEPDEEQQMAHMLMYCNMFDLEGLIACSGRYLHSARTDGRTRTRPELFHGLVDGYAQVFDNLKKHDQGWPQPDALRRIIKAGSDDYGIDAVKAGRSNEASQLVEASILKDDPRKLYIVGNAGTNTLAQALVNLDETRSQAEMDVLCRKIIVFENGAQDNAGAWIARRYPKIAWHRSNYQTYAYGGPSDEGKAMGPYTWEPYKRSAEGQNQWAEEHIMKNHGALGERFPARRFGNRLHFIEGGGTIPWMGLVNHGLTDPEHLYWGGWSGRFSRVKHKNILSRHKDTRPEEQAYGDFFMYEADSEKETWIDPVYQESFTSHYVPVGRFRRAMFNDFRARMDWYVKDYDQANHNPKAAFRGDLSDTIVRLTAKPGEIVALDATGSTDPDSDELDFLWWIYPEAGTYVGNVDIAKSHHAKTAVAIPKDSAGKQIHVILQVSDRNPIASLFDYRRVVIDIEK